MCVTQLCLFKHFTKRLKWVGGWGGGTSSTSALIRPPATELVQEVTLQGEEAAEIPQTQRL